VLAACRRATACPSGEADCSPGATDRLCGPPVRYAIAMRDKAWRRLSGSR
jgi:hypothetical protein